VYTDYNTSRLELLFTQYAVFSPIALEAMDEIMELNQAKHKWGADVGGGRKNAIFPQENNRKLFEESLLKTYARRKTDTGRR
jgi:hypothetical protein